MLIAKGQMKVSLSKTASGILGVIISIFLLLGLIFCFLISDWNTNIDQDKVRLIVKEIAKSKPQNPRLIKLYDQLNDGVLMRSTKQVTLGKFLGTRTTCPCLEVVEELYLGYQKKLSENHLLIALKIEQQVNQRDCLNYLFQNGNYQFPNKGVEEAALFYFQKPIEELTDRALMGLILIKKNPAYYNPLRNKERFEAAVNKMMKSVEPTDKG